MHRSRTRSKTRGSPETTVACSAFLRNAVNLRPAAVYGLLELVGHEQAGLLLLEGSRSGVGICCRRVGRGGWLDALAAYCEIWLGRSVVHVGVVVVLGRRWWEGPGIFKDERRRAAYTFPSGNGDGNQSKGPKGCLVVECVCLDYDSRRVLPDKIALSLADHCVWGGPASIGPVGAVGAVTLIACLDLIGRRARHPRMLGDAGAPNQWSVLARSRHRPRLLRPTWSQGRKCLRRDSRLLGSAHFQHLQCMVKPRKRAEVRVEPP